MTILQETAKQTLTLTRQRVGMALALSDKLIADADYDVIQNWLAPQILVNVQKFFWAQDVGEKRISWPANWWEHLKKSLGLRYKTAGIVVVFRAYYPEFQVKPGLGPASLKVETTRIWDETMNDEEVEP